jgi:hypothetical protein
MKVRTMLHGERGGQLRLELVRVGTHKSGLKEGALSVTGLERG